MRFCIFTISELRDWLINNQQNGISSWSIDPCRAYAFINNPCASENDPALVIVFDENNNPVGYTGAFAEDFIEGGIKGRFFWGSTEWINPEYRGKGVAAKMMHEIKNAVGYQYYLALDSSEASVRLDQKQGSKIQYFKRYKYKLSSTVSLKSRFLSRYVSFCNRKSLGKLRGIPYVNTYLSCIDEDTYAFIRSHAQSDLFLRQRQMFEWMMHYPFLFSVGEDEHAETGKCEFDSKVCLYSCLTVRVMVGDKIGGVYMISQTDETKTLRYLYFDVNYQENVMSSVVSNLLTEGVREIRFFSEALRQFLIKNSFRQLNRKAFFDNVAFTCPEVLEYDESLSIQGGDGDMFV